MMPRNHQINFGVGCFHFGFNPKEAVDFTGNDYISELKKVLGSISNIEDIQIDAFDEFKSRTFGAESAKDELNKGFNFFPFPGSSIEITFTLFIPRRIQDEMTRHHQFLDTSCERFTIITRYTYFFPITILKAITYDSDFDASDAVIICREFLEQCLSNDKSSEVNFEFLGPSPFHANFLLTPSERDDIKKFEYRRVPSHGYDRFIFYYDKDYFEDIEEAFEHLIDDLDLQLGLFYNIIHNRINRDNDWIAFYDELQHTIEKQSEKGIGAYCANTFRSESILNSLMLELAQLETYDLDLRYRLEREIQDLYLGDKPPELLPYLEKELLNLIKLPFQQVKESLNLLETRRSKRINVTMMLLSAILGGAVGALLTMALKNGG